MKITVFTPTYNRGYIIENLYKSLQRQIFTDFEWLVVDDGSKDNTEELFDVWKKEDNNFNIRYYKKENGGKHRAINYALKIIKSPYVFIVDSDDILTNDAILTINSWIDTIDDENIAAVSGLKGYNLNQPIGDISFFSGNNYIDVSNLERDKLNMNFDMAEVYKTSILKKYPFPEYDGENFITEGIVWDRIAHDGYQIRWFNKIIYICDYLDDGLTKSGRKIFIDNPKGYAQYVNQNIDYKNMNLKQRILSYYDYYLDMKCKYSLKEIANYLNISSILLRFSIYLIKIRTIIKGTLLGE